VAEVVDLVDEPDRVNLRVVAGRPLRVRLPLLLPDGSPVEAQDVDAIRAHVRPAVGSEQILHRFTTDDGSAQIVGTGTDAAAVRLVADAAETSTWQDLWPGRAPETVVWWDLEVTDTGAERHQVTTPGTITLIHQVTR
jgi:hypothetical protein